MIKKRGVRIFSREGLRDGLIGSSFIIVLTGGLMIWLSIIFFSSPLYGQLGDSLVKESFTMVSREWNENKLIQSVSYACNLNPSLDKRINCVRIFVCENYDYEDRGVLSLNTLESPEQIIREGGVCRDYAVLYKSIFDSMGLDSEIIVIPKHAYNEIKIYGQVYSVDGCNLWEET